MNASRHRGLSIVGIILYGLMAGFAMTAVIALVPVFLGLFVAGILKLLGHEHASISTEAYGLVSVYYSAIPALIAGVIVCAWQWNRRLQSLRRDRSTAE